MTALQKLVNILTGVFYLCAACAIGCFFIFRLTEARLFFEIGHILNTGWICNPTPLLSIFFAKARRFLPLLVYILCGIALVALTGGV